MPSIFRKKPSTKTKDRAIDPNHSIDSTESFHTAFSSKSFRAIITLHQRMHRIEEGVDMFHEHLTSAPSICLPASFRWAIAEEARACLTGCKGCQDLCGEGEKCERNGAAYSLMKCVPHSSSPTLPYCVTDRGSWEKVRNMVHFAINHQARADEHWYNHTIKSLGHTSLISKKRFPDEDQRAVLLATLFCEILATTLLSHAIYTTYTALGKPVPALPAFQEEWDSISPTYQDVITQGILKRNKGIRWPNKKTVSHVPIITNKDIDPTSKNWELLYPPSSRDYLLANMVDMHPLCVLSLAPASMALTGAIIGGKLSLPETMGATPWKELDSTQFCTDGGFTRANWEMMQAATAECYDTVF